MTTLVVNPIGEGLFQFFTYNLTQRLHIGAVYPYLVMVGAPAGTFTFSLSRGVEVLYSRSFTSADIKLSLGTSNDFAHAFYPVIPNNPVQIDYGYFTLSISSTGYTETSASYLGWAQQFEDVQNVLAYTPSGIEENSLAFRLKIYKEGIV